MIKEYENSQAIVKNADKLLQANELLDFSVEVEQETFRCHRFVLAVSSDFFRALLRSHMKEEKLGCVTLSGMSAPTFQIILKSLYTGKVVLTLDNFIEVWQAADQLQVDFLVQNCENFANSATTIDRCEEIFKIAKKLNSKAVLNNWKKFILNNFDAVGPIDSLMELEFNEFNELIDSHNLKVNSEDYVLETVIKWVEYFSTESFTTEEQEDDKAGRSNFSPESTTKNSLENITQMYDTEAQNVNASKTNGKRIEALPTLLKSVRTCLVSNQLLNDVLNHPLIVANTEAKDIITNAVLYQTKNENGQWPTAAMHRACSEMENCGVVCINNNTIYSIAANTEEIHICTKNNLVNADVTFVVFDSDLYATGAMDPSQANSILCVLSDKTWQKLTEIKGRRLILVPYEEGIFVVNKTNSTIYTIIKKKWNNKVLEFMKLPDGLNVKHALIYQRRILIFCSVTVNGEEKTCVHQLDILTKEFTELEQLNGPAEQIISFSDDNNTYVLQTNGKLWYICLSGNTVSFKYVEKLWNIQRRLYGALTYKQKLLVFGQTVTGDPVQQKRLDPLNGYFNNIRYWGHESPCSNFVPVVLPKTELLPS